MITLKLPQTETIFADRPYSPKAINSLFSLVKSRSAPPTLTLTVQDATRRLILFILEYGPFAAGRLIGDRFEALTLHDFFKALSETDHPTLTLNAASPVFFKCLLVLFQKVPTTSGSTDLVNVEALLQGLKSSGQEAVITCKHADALSCFYFIKGKLYEAYFANPSTVSTDSALEDQFLEYVYTVSSSSPMLVQTYEDIQVGPAEDHDLDWEESPEGIVGYFLKPRPELVFQSGETITKATIHKKVFSLGRSPESDLLVPDIQASRDHAVIREVGGVFILEDCRSRNGTIVNNQKIAQVTLSDGDEIEIGHTRILFTDKGLTPDQTSKPDLAPLETTAFQTTDVASEQTRAAAPPASQRLSLELMSGPRQGTIIPLGKKLLIGRTKADLNLNDSKVSRKHASIEEREDSYHYIDLNSTNGSFINDLPVHTKVLTPGDMISVGETILKVIEREPFHDPSVSTHHS